jgi:D-alanyl-D-alanine carboxypeptidase
MIPIHKLSPTACLLLLASTLLAMPGSLDSETDSNPLLSGTKHSLSGVQLPQNPAITIPDSLKQHLNTVAKKQALTCKCRVVIKVSDAGGDAHYAGFDGRANKEITAFGGTFEIGSCTKMFTATSIMQLVEQGKIGLEDRLADLIKEPSLLEGLMRTDSADYLGKVVLRQLLNHTSGLPEYFMDEDEKELAIHGDSTMRFTPRQLVGIANRLNEPQFEPGNEFKYTNTNYILLGMILEAHSGMPYQEYFQKRILDAAGLGDTSFPSLSYPKGREPGYWNGKPSQMPATFAGAAGELVSTLDDMDSFIRAWNDGAFFKDPETLKALKSENFNSMGMPTLNYGLGVLQLGGAFGHAGQTFGFQSFMGALPNGMSFAFAIDDAASSGWPMAIGLESVLAVQGTPGR